LPPEKNWFDDFEVRLDLGYVGFDKDYTCKRHYLPIKKKPKVDLEQSEKDINKSFAKERVKIEHSIRGMKRFRILSERLRIHDYEIYDSMLGVCAGLWNFYLSK
jgi:DDE superfamily endonuclease